MRVNVIGWRVLKQLMVAGALLALLPVTGYAQGEATLTGTVTDSTGGVLPGVTVTALHEVSGNTFVAVTDERGGYRLPVRVGAYRITAELPGFTTFTRSGVELLVGQQVIVNLEMKPSTVQESVTVTGEAPLVDTTKSNVGGNINPRQMENLPLNGRNWMDLTMMAPGSRINAVTNDLPATGAGANPGNFQINIDGQQVTQSLFYSFGQAHFSRDAIAELSVTGRFDASQGRSSGIQVNAVTKSGTNTPEGTYSGYFRSDKFNSPDFITGRTASGATCFVWTTGCQTRVLPYSNQQMAWTFGGPIKKDKIHFFVNYDFSRQPTTYTYSSPWPSFNIDQQFTTWDRKGGFRLDLQLSSRTHLAVRGNKSFYTEPIAAGGSNLHPSSPVITDRYSNDLYVTLTQVLGNRVLNEVKGGYAGFLWTREPIVKDWCCHPFGLSVGTPIIMLRGYTMGQNHNNSPQRLVSDPYSIRDDFTVSFSEAGRHTVKVGSEYMVDLVNVFLCNRCMGQYDATGGAVPANIQQLFPVWNDVNTWNLAGLSSVIRTYQVGLGQMKVYNRRQVYSGWAQDDWVPTTRLSLNLGLRYDFNTGRELDFDFPPFFGPGRPSDKNNFAPRLGFNYALNDRTVLRGGVGRYFGAPDDNETFWTLLYGSEIHPQINNDGRANFGASPFNGPVPTYDQAVALWQADVASGCAARNACRFNRFVDIMSVPDPWTPYSWQSSVGGQRQVGSSMSVEADFVVTRARGAQLGQNINLAYNPATGYNYPFTDRAKHPIQGWDGVTMRLRRADSNYYGLQMAFTKRMSNRWQGSATYLLARQYDHQVPPTQPECPYVTTLSASGAFVCDVPITLHPVLRDEWYLNPDQRNRFTFNGIWDVGYGVQLSGLYFFGDNGWATAASGVDALQTGVAGAANSSRVRADGSVIPRNNINQSPLHRVDMRVQRRFRFGSRVGIDGIFEVFNLFNHENFGSFVTNESTVANSGGNLHLGSPNFNNLLAYQPRMMQLGFRATF